MFSTGLSLGLEVHDLDLNKKTLKCVQLMLQVFAPIFGLSVFCQKFELVIR